MAKRKTPKIRKPKQLRLRGKFVTREVYDFAQRETAQRKLEKRGGRAPGLRTLVRRSQKAQRELEVDKQWKERGSRSRYAPTKKGTQGRLKASYRVKRDSVEVSISGGYEKRIYRFFGVKAERKAIDLLGIDGELRGAAWKVWTQIGTGYQKGAEWVGTRVTNAGEASGWLQGLAQQYRSKGVLQTREDGGKERGRALPPADSLWLEVVAMRPVKKGRK